MSDPTTTTRLLDLGVADVHAPAAVGAAKRAPTMKTNKLAPKKMTPAEKAKADAKAKAVKAKKKGKGKAGLFVRADLQPGGRLSVRHTLNNVERAVHCKSVPFHASGEIDPASVGVTLKGPSTYSDGSPVKLVWVNLAVPGRFRGHRAGEFELNEKVFAEVKLNFERDGLPVHFDFEHASESDPTEGSIPSTGTPAQGWVHRIEIRGGALWGLTEWLDYARSGIKAGQFGFISPAIRFNSRDRVTGENIGARLTSAALTNSPFLTRLAPPIAASDRASTPAEEPATDDTFEEVEDGETVAMGFGLAHSSHEYMPRLKAAMKLNELATPTEMSDQLARLRDGLAACGGDAAGMLHGVRLADYLHPMRDAVGAMPGMTWDQVFDLIEDLIDAAMDMHIIRDHGGDAGVDPEEDMSGAYSATENTTQMTGPSAEETNMDKIAELSAKNAELTVSLKDKGDKLSETEAKLAEASTALKEETAKREAAESELKTLKDEKAAREKKDHDDRLALAFDQYKADRKLTDDDKEMMGLLLTSNPKKFEERFPKKALPTVEEQKLTANLTDRRSDPTPTEHVNEGGAANATTLDSRALARAIAAQKGIPLAQAQRFVATSLKG